jgi:uncharacterized protein
MKYMAFLLSALSLMLSGQLIAGAVSIPGVGPSYSVNVVSYKEARFSHVVKQKYDFSCGSAAVASLLTYHYDYPVKEEEVFNAMYDMGDQEKINREGFSMLDMKTYIESLGFRADGYRITLKKLHEMAGVPAVVIINSNGYNHFVVVKGVRGSEVLVGDPALGVKVYQVDEFEQIWNGLVFIVRSDVELGRAGYDRDEEWKVRSRAAFGTVLSRRDLAQFSITLPGPMDF